MKAINIEDALRQTPFAPFEINVDRKSIVVRHPEMLQFNDSRTAMVVVEGDHFHIVDVNHVSSIKAPCRRGSHQKPTA